MKTPIYTNGKTEFKLMTINDERLIDRYAIVYRNPGAKLWMHYSLWIEKDTSEWALDTLIKAYDLHEKN